MGCPGGDRGAGAAGFRSGFRDSRSGGGGARIQGDSLCRAAGGRCALAGAGAGRGLERGACGGSFQRDLSAGVAGDEFLLRPGIFPGTAAADERGLPVPEYLDGGEVGGGASSGDGVDPRRRQRAGLRLRNLVFRWRCEAFARKRRGAGEHQLSSRYFQLFCPPRIERGIDARHISGNYWRAGPDRGFANGCAWNISGKVWRKSRRM